MLPSWFFVDVSQSLWCCAHLPTMFCLVASGKGRCKTPLPHALAHLHLLPKGLEVPAPKRVNIMGTVNRKNSKGWMQAGGTRTEKDQTNHLTAWAASPLHSRCKKSRNFVHMPTSSALAPVAARGHHWSISWIHLVNWSECNVHKVKVLTHYNIIHYATI